MFSSWCFLPISDSSNLEIFLEMMNPDDIIMAVIHDDASKKYVNISFPGFVGSKLSTLQVNCI